MAEDASFRPPSVFAAVVESEPSSLGPSSDAQAVASVAVDETTVPVPVVSFEDLESAGSTFRHCVHQTAPVSDAS